ncbi:MAG: hypothetical protein Q4A29_03965 [Eubacteriales bacterium]|nr:hypothetical protein [Eubacteriales bacterium]
MGQPKTGIGNIRKGAERISKQEKVIFCNAKGEVTQNAIYSNYDRERKEMVYYEILGQSGIDGIPYLTMKGKQLYRRILIQRVFPVKIEENKKLESVI